MVAARAPFDLPSACRLIPILPGEGGNPVRLCAVVQTQAESKSGSQLILLQSFTGGRVFLGAVTDRSGRVREWLELWVQMVSGLQGSIPAQEATLTNAGLDARWREMAAAFLAADSSACWETGWESVHAAPVWLNVTEGRAVHAVDPGSKNPYALCTDDATLIAAGLEPFSESLQRYLSVRDEPGAGLIAATADAARPANARELSDVLPGGKDLVPFNPEGGLLFVRRLAPMELRQYADLLSGRPFSGLSAGRPPVKLGGPFGGLDDWDKMQQEGGYVFSQRNGRAGRFLETLHLKLRLFAGILRCVRTAVKNHQLPMLALSTDSFRVGFATPAGGLPVLWTAHVTLTETASSVALPTPADGVRLFRPLGQNGSSVFRPAKQLAIVSGRGELRLREIQPDRETLRVEGTISAGSLAKSSVSDVIRLRVPLPGGPTVELWGTINSADGLAQGEARFRTLSVELAPEARAALTRAAGLVLPGTPFETVPMLSSPSDLFSLGVIAVQIFLASGGDGLAVALDEALSLARTLDVNAKTSLGEQARALAAADARWVRSLGPQCHGHQPVTVEEAFSYVPLELWWDVVGTIARLFPGAGAASYCRDLGDAPPQRIEAVFDQPISDWEKLVFRSQSLLLGDWMANREVARVVQRMR